MKLKPVNIDDSNKIIDTIKTMSDVAEFEVKTANEINRAIKEFNQAIALVSSPYDDTAIKKSIDSLKKSMPVGYDDSQLKKSIDSLKKSVPTAYDDSQLKKSLKQVKSGLLKVSESFNFTDIYKSIKSLEAKIPTPYDDSKIIEMFKSIKMQKPVKVDNSESDAAMALMIDEIKNLKAEIVELKALAASNQKEVRSNRKESGLKIDILEQKVNAATEIK